MNQTIERIETSQGRTETIETREMTTMRGATDESLIVGIKINIFKYKYA